MDKRIYITTPIYYINAKPHIGHAYTTILCDVVRRFYRLLGYETYFLTGTDEHGDKIYRAALEAGCPPEQYTNRISSLYRELWPDIHIKPDDFIRTTEDRHKKVVREILQKIYDKGEIYHARYGGHYCTGCERFLTEKELVEGKCPDHDKEPEWIEEENYFFRMSAYQEKLIRYIEDNPDFIRPERYRNETLSFLKEPLKDLCISRPKSRLPWGIPLPFDEEYVTYVWFDALVNYVSALGYPDSDLFDKFWPVVNHFTAKDILKPHAVYWPCMLMAAGIPLYEHLNVHGWWSIDKKKMSKSMGNVVAPLDLADKYGVDAFRYFLLRDMTFGLDADFSEENVILRYNSDLANDFGNLVSRVTKMILKYNDGVIPDEGKPNEEDEVLIKALSQIRESMEEKLESLKFNELIEQIMSVVRATNKYVNDQAPWELHKKGDTERLGAVLNIAAQITASCAKLLLPVMPEKCRTALGKFGIFEVKETSVQVEFTGQTRASGGDPLFPRIKKSEAMKKETTTENEDKEEKKEKKVAEKEGVQLIEYTDFSKVELRTALILAAEPVPGTDKLMRIDTDLGFEKRQIIAGIAKDYTGEELIGKTIVVVANLKPRKLRGLLSQGMLLAAHGEKGLALITVDNPVNPGSVIS